MRVAVMVAFAVTVFVVDQGVAHAWLDNYSIGTTYYAAPTVQPAAKCDDCGVVVNLPWAFPYYAGSYTQVTVSSNGYVLLGNRPSEATMTPPAHALGWAGSADVPDQIIAPLWDNWNLALGGNVYTGVAPDGAFTVEWRDVAHYGAGTTTTCQTCYDTCYDSCGSPYSCNPYSCNCTTGPGPTYTFELKLYADGSFHFLYPKIVAGNAAYDYGVGATIGYQDEGNTVGEGISYRGTIRPTSSTSSWFARSRPAGNQLYVRGVDPYFGNARDGLNLRLTYTCNRDGMWCSDGCGGIYECTVDGTAYTDATPYSVDVAAAIGREGWARVSTAACPAGQYFGGISGTNVAAYWDNYTYPGPYETLNIGMGTQFTTASQHRDYNVSITQALVNPRPDARVITPYSFTNPQAACWDTCYDTTICLAAQCCPDGCGGCSSYNCGAPDPSCIGTPYLCNPHACPAVITSCAVNNYTNTNPATWALTSPECPLGDNVGGAGITPASAGQPYGYCVSSKCTFLSKLDTYAARASTSSPLPAAAPSTKGLVIIPGIDALNDDGSGEYYLLLNPLRISPGSSPTPAQVANNFKPIVELQRAGTDVSIGNYADGNRHLEQMRAEVAGWVNTAYTRAGNQKVILAGVSQGGVVMKMAAASGMVTSAKVKALMALDSPLRGANLSAPNRGLQTLIACQKYGQSKYWKIFSPPARDMKYENVTTCYCSHYAPGRGQIHESYVFGGTGHNWPETSYCLSDNGAWHNTAMAPYQTWPTTIPRYAVSSGDGYGPTYSNQPGSTSPGFDQNLFYFHYSYSYCSDAKWAQSPYDAHPGSTYLHYLDILDSGNANLDLGWGPITGLGCGTLTASMQFLPAFVPVHSALDVNYAGQTTAGGTRVTGLDAAGLAGWKAWATNDANWPHCEVSGYQACKLYNWVLDEVGATTRAACTTDITTTTGASVPGTQCSSL
ncbi:MAG TPA: hypothetical protein VGQ83_16950 [Polyangia bacterium]